MTATSHVAGARIVAAATMVLLLPTCSRPVVVGSAS